MATDLEKAFGALTAKQAVMNAQWAYYDGDQPLMYTNKRLEEIFQALDARFTQNWCAVVIDACNERIDLAGWQCADETAQELLGALWRSQQLDLESDEVHLAMLVTGEAFMVVWPMDDEDDGQEIHAYYNDPRLCHAQYKTDDPHQMAWAAKWWVDDDGKRRLTLYYRDRLEYYVSVKDALKVGKAADLLPADVPSAPNPYNEIPVFHFRAQRRVTKSDLKNIVPLQNGINKLLVDMMVGAEYGAFRQRYVISSATNLGKLKNAPNEIWDLPAGDGQGQQTQVGEFSQTDLGNYLKAVDSIAGSIAAISRTPKHYFFSQGGDPSGEALIAMEAPLIKKVQDRIDQATPVWSQVAEFMLRLAGVADAEVTPVFADPRTIQPVTQALVRMNSVKAGMPLKTVLRSEGWDAEKLAQLDVDLEEQAQSQSSSLGAALAEQQRQFDAGQTTA